MKKIRVAQVGFGGIGHTHASGYPMEGCELVALCDINEKVLNESGATINIGSSQVKNLDKIAKYTDFRKMLKVEKPDMVDICIPTPLHVEYAIIAMKAGCHVLSEKPMGLNSRQCRRLIDAAKKYGVKVMVAQVLRFCPSYEYIRDSYKDGRYGKLLRLDMRRLSSCPVNAWYNDHTQSGGAILDLHLHDTDFVNSLLGAPDAVTSRGIVGCTGGIDDVFTVYEYKNGPVVTASGSWFRDGWDCKYAAIFEKATVTTTGGDNVVVSQYGRNPETIKFENPSGYANEIAYLADCIANDKAPERCPLESTMESVRIVEAEMRSIRLGRTVRFSAR
ncbi:MAG: Gfo/Idh/MocA family oxidoreductase [Victivallales bacterium]|nr:Gfo/Idh/MocA family oxidoreductase [Victivallales bacterium]